VDQKKIAQFGLANINHFFLQRKKIFQKNQKELTNLDAGEKFFKRI